MTDKGAEIIGLPGNPDRSAVPSVPPSDESRANSIVKGMRFKR